MRILFLTILLFAPLYYFSRNTVTTEAEVDTIGLKASAPDRIERILTVEPTVKSRPSPDDISEVSTTVEEESDEESSDSEEDRAPAVAAEDVEEVHMGDLEEGWNGELKQILNRLEPAAGDEIHQAYLQEQENYRVMVDGLMSEKSDKTSKEASLEIEQMIQQIDHNHQERLKEILGPHYEAVRDSYDEYMESVSQEE
jgi:hypothetical protein